jgi:hypothetical protein
MEVFAEIPDNFYLQNIGQRSGADKTYLHRNPRGERLAPQEGWVLFISVKKDCVQRFYKHAIPFLNELFLGQGFRGLDHKLVMNQKALDSMKQKGKIVVIRVCVAHINHVIKQLDGFLAGLRLTKIIEPGPIPQRAVGTGGSEPEAQLGESGILYGRKFALGNV